MIDYLDQRMAAYAILSAATPGPATDQITWAAGVVLGQHPWDLVHAWDGSPLIGHEMQGSTLDNDLWFWSVSGRITIGPLEGEPIVQMFVSTVARLVAVRRLPAALVAEVRAVFAERCERNVEDLRQYGRYQRGEIDLEADRAWRDSRREGGDEVERRCELAGARVWDHVRPGREPVQLDLFTVGGAR